MTVVELMKRWGLPNTYAISPPISPIVGRAEACTSPLPLAARQLASIGITKTGHQHHAPRVSDQDQRKRESSARRIEEVRVWMCGTTHERCEELGRRGTERHAMAGEATTHERAFVDAADVGKRIVGKAHRPGPAVRDGGADMTLAQESLELLLDHVGGALLLADLLGGRGVPPAADQHATVARLPPVAIAPVGVGRARENER